MDKQPVGTLPDLTASSLDDEIMIITEADTSQLRKEKISNILTDIISVQENNALVKGSDDKLFVTNFGNASNITEGTLPTSVLPQIPTEKLPQTGVEAGEYSYPSSVTVNAQGQITAIEEGQIGAGNANQDLTNLSSKGEKHFLNKSQITNCILEVASTPAIVAQSYSDAAYVNHGATIQDNIASNFSADNFILLNKTFTDSTTFDFEIPINLPDITGTQIIAAINNYDNCIGINNGVLFLRYNGEQLNGTAQIPINTDVGVKLSRTTTGGYTLSYKTTGEYIEEISLPSDAGYFAGKSIYLGSRNNYYLKGTISLSNTQITADSTSYWTNSTLLDFQTVDIEATLDLLMPNGRNSDGTLNNIQDTQTIADTLLYLPTGGEKTILVKENGEIMIRDYYIESLSEPQQAPLSGVWFDTNKSIIYEQLATYPNFINTGAEIEEGIVTINSATGYIQLPSNYDLGENWSISLPINLAASNQGVVIGNMAVDSSAAIQYLPDSIGVYYDGTNLNAYFRRSDVYQVQKDGTTIGYTKTEGVESTLTAADTVIYSDINCTNIQATATGSDYIYTGVTSPSLIGTLSTAYSGGEDITLNIAYNGSQYSFNSQTLNSGDNVRNGAIITLGGTNEAVSTNISGTIDLNNAQLSFWKWNEISDSASDFLSFVGARIGKTQDDGTTITNLRIDNPVTIANALYCANTDATNFTDAGFARIFDEINLRQEINYNAGIIPVSHNVFVPDSYGVIIAFPPSSATYRDFYVNTGTQLKPEAYLVSYSGAAGTNSLSSAVAFLNKGEQYWVQYNNSTVVFYPYKGV